MKIDAYVPSIEANGTLDRVADRSKSSTTSNTPSVSTEDTTSFASGTASVQALTDAALDTSSRSAKVAALKQEVQSGQYTYDPAEIATALTKWTV